MGQVRVHVQFTSAVEFNAVVNHGNEWTIEEPTANAHAVENLLAAWASDTRGVGYVPCASYRWAKALVKFLPGSYIVEGFGPLDWDPAVEDRWHHAF